MAKTANAKTIGAHVPNEIAALLKERAEAINTSESRYLRMILEKWVADGCPAVCPMDEMAQRVAPKKRTA